MRAEQREEGGDEREGRVVEQREEGGELRDRD